MKRFLPDLDLDDGIDSFPHRKFQPTHRHNKFLWKLANYGEQQRYIVNHLFYNGRPALKTIYYNVLNIKRYK